MVGLKSALVLVLSLVSSTAYAYTSPGAPDGYVNDFADVLTPAEEILLEQELSNIEASSDAELAVVIVSNLDGDTIENYAVQLFQEWGIGKKGADNGVLLLASLNERSLRIEVGYGLEGELTDAESYSIIRDVITPEFAASRYYLGIDKGITAIAEAINVEYPLPTSQPSNSFSQYDIATLVAIFTVTVMMIFRSLRKNLWAGPLLAGAITYGFTDSIGSALVAVIATILIMLIGMLPGGGSGGVRSGPSSFGGSSRSSGGFGGGRSGGGGASGRW